MKEKKMPNGQRIIVGALSILELIRDQELSANKEVVEDLFLYCMNVIQNETREIIKGKKKYNAPVSDMQAVAAALFLQLEEEEAFHSNLPGDVKKWCQDSVRLWQQVQKSKVNS